MDARLYFKEIISKDLKSIVSRHFVSYIEGLFVKTYADGVKYGKKKQKEKSLIYIEETRGRWELVMKDSMYKEMVVLLGRHKNNYQDLLLELTQKINQL